MRAFSAIASVSRPGARTLLTALAVAAVTTLSGCATPPQLTRAPDRGPSPEAEIRAGVTALEAGDFASARERLAPLTVGCVLSPVARRAALLRASAELDPNNPDGAPTTAAALAARVFVQSPSGEPEAAMARSLYAMALDRGAAVPAEPSDPTCGPAASREAALLLPPAAEPSTAARLSALGDSLSASSDSIMVLRAQVSAAEERARVLEQELERIRQLLRGGVDPHS